MHRDTPPPCAPASAADPRTCPGCGRSNACAQAQAQAEGAAPCWCFAMDLPKALFCGDDLSGGWACFCADCVRAAQEAERAADSGPMP